MTIPVGPPPGQPAGPPPDSAGRPDPAAAHPAAAHPAAAAQRATRASLYVPANLLVLAWFVGAGVVTLGHRFVPEAGWLMVHLLLAGGVSTAILLWSQHFAETLLRRPAPGGRRGLWLRLIGWTVGALLVTAGTVLGGRGPGLAAVATAATVAGGILAGVVALAHVAVLVRQARAGTAGGRGGGRGARAAGRLLGNRFAHLVRYYVVAGALLPPGIAAGVLMARLEPGPEPMGRLYLAHVLLTVLGWIGLTVAGTAVLLFPTVLHTRIDDEADRAGRWALPVMGAGLALTLVATATGVRVLVGPGCLVVAAGIAWLGWQAGREAVAASRAAGHTSGTGGGLAAWSIAASLVWFACCVVALGVTVVRAPTWAAVPGSLTGLVAPFAAGFVAQVMVGSMTYLLPVVLGGGPGAVRWSIAELTRWGGARFVVLNACVLLFALPLPSWVAVTVSTLGLGSLLAFLVLAVRTVLVQRRRPSRTLPQPRPDAEVVRERRLLTRTRTLTSAASGAALVVAAVVLGVAADPVAAGVTALPATAAGGSGAASGSDAAQPTGETTTVEVTMSGMTFTPDVIEVPVGNALVLDVTNDGDQVHDLVLASGASSGRLYPGESATVEAGVITADLDGWCSVAGHRVLGMTLRIVAVASDDDTTVTADAPDGDTGHAGHGSDGTPDAGEPSVADTVNLAALLHGDAPDGFAARDATLAPAATSGTDAQGITSEPDPDGTGTLHRITMTVEEVETEVAPGVRQTLWTFNGTAPGPVLRGKVGDTFEITLVNDGSLGHSIDFHAGALAPDEPMRTISPGESLTYVFRAERSGIWMYHCSTMPMSLHIANGMMGAVVIDPEDLAPVDREYVLVQSELYLGPQGGTADPERIATQNPDLMAFNGYANQYRWAPLRAEVGERVRLWVLDVGPNRPSAFHVVGGQFDTVFLEGDYALRDGGSTGSGGSQVLGLLPAQGGFVELTFPEAGHYSFVTHAMSDAEKGAAGTVEVREPGVGPGSDAAASGSAG
ncbi:multicopper oxidase domain-containing protein [Salana multivorans]|uniref:multicopper oxidase domain-containing protein n=1 Tax=Salana multivorans TaxID=120377 RepID=UPI000AB225E9|nr:multicopper oxidase domain-containing protein [Salana multivorans]